MRMEDSFFYTIVDLNFYDTIERYKPKSVFVEPLLRVLPSDWQISQSGIWFQCNPPGAMLPQHGWKIHLTTTPTQAAAVLTTAARVLVAKGVPFKFAVDRNMLLIVNGKRWARSGAGKFITIYPRTKDEFIHLLEELHQALLGYNGPYILSDKRYKDGSIVYYRYGGMVRASKVNFRGEEDLMITAPDGESVIDERSPYFTPPEWAADPVLNLEEETDSNQELTLKDGRYVIESALTFTTSGGVYIGKDTETGRKVLIKEARPFANPSQGEHDAVSLLKKEHRLLTILEDTGLVPQPYDFFKDWEHFYLVEEFLEGFLLRSHMIEISLALQIRPTLKEATEFYERYRKLYGLIAKGFHTVHERNITLADVSHYNIIVTDEGNAVKFIDFEGARELGVDVSTMLYTPGFASEQRERSWREPTIEDDYYGFGGLMLAGLMPINAVRSFGYDSLERFLNALTTDFGLPYGVRRAISAAMHPEPSQRIKPLEAIAMLEDVAEVTEPSIESDEAKEECGDDFIRRTLDFMLGVASFDRTDRLFPSDAYLFRTNPLSLAWGACGVAYVINEIRGKVPQEVSDWILRTPVDYQRYAPGLYVGLSGIAWALSDMGFKQRALEMICATHNHPMLYESPDIFYGVSGWGMAQLKFFLETGDELFLSKAIEGGQFLLDTQQEDESGSWWPVKDDIFFGLAHGASGVSLFLFYLYLVTRNEKFLDVGTRGIDFVLSKAMDTKDGGYTWKMVENWPTQTPYWRYGGAGIGMTLLRYGTLFGQDRYKPMLDKIALDCDRKYTIFPTRFFGLAGLGEFFLDMADFGVEESTAVECAWKNAAGALLFKVEREQGIAFPGEQLMRLSCDFGTGSAGIALFLHRLLNRGKPPFMLDSLLETEALQQKSFAEVSVA